MRSATTVLLAFLAVIVLSGCDLAEGILKFGFWSGVVLVVVIGGVIWLVARMVKR